MPPLPSARPMATLPTIRVARAATAASLLSSLTAAQTPDVTVLARAGDVLPSGETIVDMSGAQIGNDGTWAALLLYGGGTPLERALAVDGSVVLEVGDSLSSGSIVYSLNDLSVSRSGEVTVLVRTDDGGTITDRVLVDGAPLVAGGDSIPTPLGPLEVQGIRAIDFDDGRLTMICTLLSTSTIVEATWYGRVTPGGMIDDVVWFEGDLIPGSPNPFERGVIDTDLSGTYTSLAVELDGPSGPIAAILQSGNIVAEHGGPAPIPGRAWDFTLRGRGRTSVNAGSLIAGVTTLPGGGTESIIALDGNVLVREGQPLPGLPGETVGAFPTAPLFLTDALSPLFVVPLAGGGSALMEGDIPILRSGQSLPGGQVIDGVLPSGLGQTFDATTDGRTLIQVIDVSGIGNTLVLLERGLGDPVACTPEPNSSGAPGRLRAEGSNSIGANDLTITAASLPLSSFGYLLTSRTAQTTPMAGGSAGTLCLGGEIGRFVGQVASSGTTGRITTIVDLNAIPQPTGFVTGAAGERWTFQLWHRDGVMGVATSNFTEAVSVTLQ